MVIIESETTDDGQSPRRGLQASPGGNVHALGSVVSRGIRVRDATDEDSWDLIGLIASCWSEYPGCVLDLDNEVPYYRTIATSFASLGGRFWVAEQSGRVVGSVGLTPTATAGEIELRMLYVARAWRKQGLASRLVALLEDEAKRRGATSITLWSDTRFVDAHRLYERLGYARGGTRELHDLSKTIEHNFTKRLDR